MDKGKEILKAWNIINKTFIECGRLCNDFKLLFQERLKDLGTDSSPYLFKPSNYHLYSCFWDYLYKEKDEKRVEAFILEILFDPIKLEHDFNSEEPLLIVMRCLFDKEFWDTSEKVFYSDLEEAVINFINNKGNSNQNIRFLKGPFIIPLFQITNKNDLEEKIINRLL